MDFQNEIYAARVQAYQQWTLEQRLNWLEHWVQIYRNSTTREERIAHYRAKRGKNLAYYEANGFPEGI